MWSLRPTVWFVYKRVLKSPSKIGTYLLEWRAYTSWRDVQTFSLRVWSRSMSWTWDGAYKENNARGKGRVFKTKTAILDDHGWKSWIRGMRGLGTAKPTPACGSSTFSVVASPSIALAKSFRMGDYLSWFLQETKCCLMRQLPRILKMRCVGVYNVWNYLKTSETACQVFNHIGGSKMHSCGSCQMPFIDMWYIYIYIFTLHTCTYIIYFVFRYNIINLFMWHMCVYLCTLYALSWLNFSWSQVNPARHSWFFSCFKTCYDSLPRQKGWIRRVLFRRDKPLTEYKS